MHSSRMSTARLSTVSHSVITWAEGVSSLPGGGLRYLEGATA